MRSPRGALVLAATLAVVALATSSSAQIRLGSNGIYDVAVAETGAYTARTGPAHPIVAGQNLFYAGSANSPGTTWNSIRSYDSSREFYLMQAFGAPQASPGFTCQGINAVATRLVEDILTSGVVTGTRSTWTIDDANDSLTVVQEVNAEGVAFEDSVVRVTTCITNDDTRNDASVGIRFQWDWQIGSNDGAYLGIRPPNPPTEPFLGTEQDFPNPTFDSYDVSDTQSPTTNPPLYRVGGTVLNPQLSMGPTPPELVQYASWPASFGPGASTTCFTLQTLGRPVGNIDSAVTYYWGATPGTAIVLAPGQTFCATQYVFAFSEDPPPLCQLSPVVTGGSGCDVPSILVSAFGSSSTDCAGQLQYSFTDPTGTLAEDWSNDPYHDATMSGTWTVGIQCDTDRSCAATRQVEVELDLTPIFGGALVRDAASCNLGIELTWPDANFRDSGRGSYNVYRSESGCGDVAPQLLVAGLGVNRYVDTRTAEGTSYYYFVEAEDAQVGTLCPFPSPGPTNSGSVTRLCLGPVTDVADPTAPAGVCYTLRVGHAGDQVTADWSLARPLLPGEHFHLLKALDSPTAPFTLVNPEGDLGRSYSEVDLTRTLQLFDLRVANACEVESADDEPPSLTGDPQPCP